MPAGVDVISDIRVQYSHNMCFHSLYIIIFVSYTTSFSFIIMQWFVYIRFRPSIHPSIHPRYSNTFYSRLLNPRTFLKHLLNDYVFFQVTELWKSGHQFQTPLSLFAFPNQQHWNLSSSWVYLQHLNFNLDWSASSLLHSLWIFFHCTRYNSLDVRRKNATRESTSTLKAWLYEHIKNPYPTKAEKIMLAIITKMTLTQVLFLAVNLIIK